MSIRFIQPEPNPYAGLFSLIGGIMGDNARQRREQKASEATIGVLNPTNVDLNTGPKSELQIDPSLTKMTPYQPTPQFQMPIQQQPSLLSGAPADMSYEGLVKQPNVTGNNALTMPQMQAPQTPQATVNTRQRGIKDVEKEIRADYYSRLSQAVKEKKLTSADVKELMPAMRQQMAADIASAKESYTQKQQDEAYSAFETEQDPRKKIMIGMKAGLIGKEGAMLLIQPGTETKVINTGSENVVVGFNKLTGRYVNLKDNSEIPAEELQAMLKPTAKPKAASEYELWKMANGVGIPRGGSGGGDSSETGFTKAENTALTKANATITTFHSRWKDPYNETGLRSGYEKDPLYQAYQQAVQIQNNIYGSKGTNGQAQPQPRQANVTPDTVAQALATGKYTIEQIAEYTGVPVEQIRAMAPAKQTAPPNQFGTGFNRSLAQIAGQAPINPEELVLPINELDNRF